MAIASLASADQRLDNALGSLQHTLKNNPGDVTALCSLGRFFWEAGREEEFKKCLRQSVEVLKAAMRNNALEAVLQVEHLIYTSLVTTVESEEHYYRCFSLWRDDMAAFGRRYRASDDAPATIDPARVAFILHTGVVLGHTEVMFRHLESLRNANPLGIKPRIYVLGQYAQDFLDRARALEVDVVAMPNPKAGYGARIAALRAQMKADGYGVAVWMCVPVMSIFMLSARIAPVQIYWSQKFHAVTGPFIDGYISWGAWGEKEKTYGKQAWQVCPTPLAMAYAPPSPEAIAAFRRPYGDAFILGVLAREEKINTTEYLDAVCRILQENPNCVFLWTGKTQPLQVVEYFRSKGVAERCHFIGWVDTTLASAAIDLFLETFPFGCGITAFQALKAKTPLLSYRLENTLFGMEFGVGWKGECPVLAAGSREEYCNMANELIRNPARRAEVAAAEHAYFLAAADMAKYTERFFNTVHAITLEKMNGSN